MLNNKLDQYLFAVTRVSYDTLTGVMTWLPTFRKQSEKISNPRYCGKECGRINSDGYRMIHFRINTIESAWIPTHRLAWFITYGDFPIGQIDHINQDRTDNRLSNLRDVSPSVNNRNRGINPRNKSGVNGVYWSCKARKWKAQAVVLGKQKHLGFFDSISDAEKAAKEFRLANEFTEMHGRHTGGPRA